MKSSQAISCVRWPYKTYILRAVSVLFTRDLMSDIPVGGLPGHRTYGDYMEYSEQLAISSATRKPTLQV
jgi:hypothetical protein